jgi:hypothetical protein
MRGSPSDLWTPSNSPVEGEELNFAAITSVAIPLVAATIAAFRINSRLFIEISFNHVTKVAIIPFIAIYITIILPQ